MITNDKEEKRKRVILFTRTEYFSQALNAYLMVSSQQPNQELGTEFGVDIEVGGVDLLVIRNEDSYTVEEV